MTLLTLIATRKTACSTVHVHLDLAERRHWLTKFWQFFFVHKSVLGTLYDYNCITEVTWKVLIIFLIPLIIFRVLLSVENEAALGFHLTSKFLFWRCTKVSGGWNDMRLISFHSWPQMKCQNTELKQIQFIHIFITVSDTFLTAVFILCFNSIFGKAHTAHLKMYLNSTFSIIYDIKLYSLLQLVYFKLIFIFV